MFVVGKFPHGKLHRSAVAVKGEHDRVFQDHSREFYDLEGLWSDAPREVFSPDIIKEIEVAGEMDEEEDDFLIS